jgi:uncharacterized protein
MKNNFPSTILNVIELIFVSFFIASVFSIPFFNSGLEDSISGLIIFTFWGFSIVIYSWLRNKRKWPYNFNFQLSGIKNLLIIILFFLILSIGIDSPLNYFLSEVFNKNNESTLITLFSVFSIGAIIVGPIVEELVFRGIILDFLKNKYNNRAALIVSSVAFGLIHVHPNQVVIALIIGFMLGFLFIKTNSLLLVILIHSLTNLTSILNGELRGILLMSENPMKYLVYKEWTWIIFGCSVLICAYLFIKFFQNDKTFSTNKMDA